MKKPRAKQKKHQQKRARKEAQRRKVRKEKMKLWKEEKLYINSLSDEEYREYMGDDYEEDDEFEDENDY